MNKYISTIAFILSITITALTHCNGINRCLSSLRRTCFPLPLGQSQMYLQNVNQQAGPLELSIGYIFQTNTFETTRSDSRGLEHAYKYINMKLTLKNTSPAPVSVNLSRWYLQAGAIKRSIEFVSVYEHARPAKLFSTKLEGILEAGKRIDLMLVFIFPRYANPQILYTDGPRTIALTRPAKNPTRTGQTSPGEKYSGIIPGTMTLSEPFCPPGTKKR